MTDHPDQTAPAKATSLRQRAVRASIVELVGFGGTQVIRLASNLWLTRLVAKDDFGLSATVMVICQGLMMMSDVGLAQSFVRSSNSDKAVFQDTVWTLQVIRGVALWLMASALSWPLAWFFERDILLTLLPIGSLLVVCNGFVNVSLYMLRRRLQVVPLIALELMAQAVNLGVMVWWASCSPSVWVLAVGPLAGEILKTAASHLLPDARRPRFCLDREARREIIRFGKWIFLSSALCFLATQSDRLFVQKLEGEGVGGVYNVAILLSSAVLLVVTRLVHGVLFPVLSQIQRDRPETLAHSYHRVRLRTDLASLFPLGGLFACSPWVVHFLYRDEYADAGWMLRVLCLRVALQALVLPVETALFSVGQTRFSFYRDLARTTFLFTGLPLLYASWGIEGLLWGVAIAELPTVVILWGGAMRHHLFALRTELRALGMFAGGLLLGLAISPLLPEPWWR